jgi:uncharacterized cupredoxin-like copper-binding protein
MVHHARPSDNEGGDPEINATNSGTILHEIGVLKINDSFDQLTVVGGNVKEASVGEVVGEIDSDDLPAGGTATQTFHIEVGNYALICNIPANYEQGMRVAFTVK